MLLLQTPCKRLVSLLVTSQLEGRRVHSRVNSFTLVATSLPSDFGHSGERPVGRHDGQGEAAALVPEDGGGIPGSALRQLHQQLEGREALQRHHTQTQVRATLSRCTT